jgi:hypothetical protein
MIAVSPVVPVFVSSTWHDLQDERRAVEDVLNGFRETKFSGMEYFGSQREGAGAASLAEVDRAVLYIGIFGARRGSGLTEAEYRRAKARGLSCLIYLKASAIRGALDEDGHYAAFISDLRTNRDQLVSEFTTPAQLAVQVAVDIHKWLFDQYLIPWFRTAVAEHAAPEHVDPVLAAVSERLSLGPELLRDLRSAGYELGGGRTARSAGKRAGNELDRLADRVDQIWIRGVLNQTVHAEAMIAIERQSDPRAVESPWARHLELGLGGAALELRQDEPIWSAFASAGRYLLILGAPGSGKTITMLELTRNLLDLYRSGVELEVPVVLNLATWRRQHREFANWCAAEIAATYNVPGTTARAWLDHRRLTLMLDGLDEVPESHRSSCAEALNAFLSSVAAPGAVVTCRSDEYGLLTTRVRLSAAVRLQPLTDEQIDEYLGRGGPRVEGLRDVVKRNADLRTLARTPLILSIMTLAFKDVPESVVVDTLAGAERRAAGSTAFRDALFGLFTQTMFRYRRTPAVRREQILRHLRWTSRTMQGRGTSVFSLERLQPSWLQGSTRLVDCIGVPLAVSTLLATLFVLSEGLQPGAWTLATAVVVGGGGSLAMIDALRWLVRRAAPKTQLAGVHNIDGVVWLLLYLIAPLIGAGLIAHDTDVLFAMTVGVIALLSYGFSSAFRGPQSEVRLGYEFSWSWLRGWQGAAVGLTVGFFIERLFAAWDFEIFGSQQSLREFLSDFIDSLGAAQVRTIVQQPLVWILATGGFLIGGLKPSIRERTIRPYDGVARTARRSALIATAVTLVILVLSTWDNSIDWSEPLEAVAGATLMLCCFWLGFGGLDLVRYGLLRILLAVTGHLPLRAVRLLDEETSLVFLRRAGGSYIFVHRMLLEYFATLPWSASDGNSRRPEEVVDHSIEARTLDNTSASVEPGSTQRS